MNRQKSVDLLLLNHRRVVTARLLSRAHYVSGFRILPATSLSFGLCATSRILHEDKPSETYIAFMSAYNGSKDMIANVGQLLQAVRVNNVRDSLPCNILRSQKVISHLLWTKIKTYHICNVESFANTLTASKLGIFGRKRGGEDRGKGGWKRNEEDEPPATSITGQNLEAQILYTDFCEVVSSDFNRPIQ